MRGLTIRSDEVVYFRIDPNYLLACMTVRSGEIVTIDTTLRTDDYMRIDVGVFCYEVPHD